MDLPLSFLFSSPAAQVALAAGAGLSTAGSIGAGGLAELGLGQPSAAGPRVNDGTPHQLPVPKSRPQVSANAYKDAVFASVQDCIHACITVYGQRATLRQVYAACTKFGRIVCRKTGGWRYITDNSHWKSQVRHTLYTSGRFCRSPYGADFWEVHPKFAHCYPQTTSPALATARPAALEDMDDAYPQGAGSDGTPLEGSEPSEGSQDEPAPMAAPATEGPKRSRSAFQPYSTSHFAAPAPVERQSYSGSDGSVEDTSTVHIRSRAAAQHSMPDLTSRMRASADTVVSKEVPQDDTMKLLAEAAVVASMENSPNATPAPAPQQQQTITDTADAAHDLPEMPLAVADPTSSAGMAAAAAAAQLSSAAGMAAAAPAAIVDLASLQRLLQNPLFAAGFAEAQRLMALGLLQPNLAAAAAASAHLSGGMMGLPMAAAQLLGGPMGAPLPVALQALALQQAQLQAAVSAVACSALPGSGLATAASAGLAASAGMGSCAELEPQLKKAKVDVLA